MERILTYAKERDYTKYTSTLKEAWRQSISGLSGSFTEALDSHGENMELGPDDDYLHDPASQFGIREAEKHRERGISLDMFLGLMKYYRQTYSDLIRESDFDNETQYRYERLLKRYFDRVEIGFCKNWSLGKNEAFIKILQSKNRDITNEKNKYLTIFESLSNPVFVVDKSGIIENMNHAASRMFDHTSAPGAPYYEDTKMKKNSFTDVFPWLKESYDAFTGHDENSLSFELAIGNKNKYYYVSYSRSLDISDKYSGVMVMIEDISKRKIMEKELERLATTDPLTGSKNRRSFLDLFEKEYQRSKRYNHNFALFMMDIDHFKTINDTFGHDMGDMVLKILVAQSYSVLRDSDIFGRWGGEEFIIMLPETDLTKASAAAERLRAVLSESKLVTDTKEEVHFTVSIGFTVVTDKEATVHEIIKKADHALYQAKHLGRNRVEFL